MMPYSFPRLVHLIQLLKLLWLRPRVFQNHGFAIMFALRASHLLSLHLFAVFSSADTRTGVVFSIAPH